MQPATRRGVAYKWVALSNTTLGTLMAALDTNIVIIALPTIGRQLAGTTPLDILWILLGYALVTSVVLLSFGRLSDQFGRTRMYTTGFAVFTVASLLCSLSQTGLELVLFRMVQAIGAGFLFANSAAILTDAFPPHERGRALGVNQIAIVAGAVSGLLLGGVLTGTLGWRSIFYVNVPIGIFATLWAHYRLRELAELDRVQHIDWAGNLTFGGGLASLLAGITFDALGVIGFVPFLGLVVLGTALLVGFVVIERRTRYPLFDLSLFRIPTFTGTNVAILLNSIARGAFAFMIVFYLQGPPRFLGPLTAGLFMVPVSASLAVFGPISGTLSDRYGSRPFAVAGLIISAIGFFLLTMVGPATTFWGLLVPFVLVGSGFGIFASPNRAAMMSSVPARRRGVAAGTGTTLMNAGQTVSLGVAVLVISRTLPPSSLGAIFTGKLGAIPPDFRVADFMSGIHLVFLISAILMLAAVVPSVLRPPSAGPAPPATR
ncbi:MAG TPA: MFS transporter [Thermoplasmata archaeon]|nr:MFS transporter [Thermoplasmata archaeon]